MPKTPIAPTRTAILGAEMGNLNLLERRIAWYLLAAAFRISSETELSHLFMLQKKSALPIVLSIAGHDPSSGAGITADIKTIAAHGDRKSTRLNSSHVSES